MSIKVARNLLLSLLVTVVVVPSVWAQSPETIELNVEGLNEQRCEDVVGSLLHRVPGISSVIADHESDRVTVEFDPGQATAEEVAAAIDWCPSFAVTGSNTHSLDMERVRDLARRSACRDADRCAHEI